MGDMIRFEGKRLACLRVTSNLSQRELGERVGLSGGYAQQTVSKWERRVVIPDADTLAMLAVALDCGISEFYCPVAADRADLTIAASA